MKSLTLVRFFTLTNYKLSQVLSGFHWLKSQKLEADWITVTDDDCFMNVTKVVHTFNQTQVNESGNKIFCGLSKWVDAVPFDKYGWIMSMELVNF